MYTSRQDKEPNETNTELSSNHVSGALDSVTYLNVK